VKLLYLLPLLTLFAIPAFAVSDNYGVTSITTTDPNICLNAIKHGITCYQYDQPNVGKVTASNSNWTMDIMAPDWTCNILGGILSDGSCSYKPVILSNDNFTTLKSDPAVLGVIHIQNSAMTTQNYCPVAIWTWNTQDDAFKTKYLPQKNLVIPDSCNPQPIPEFPLIPSLILVASIG
jgi:hypothetical protein